MTRGVRANGFMRMKTGKIVATCIVSGNNNKWKCSDNATKASNRPVDLSL